MRQSAIGLNFADIYQRKGAHGPHSATPFPITLGSVGAGTVTAIGPGVEGVRVGQRVACIHPGAYQVTRNVPAGRLVPLPETIAEEVAGATLLRGLTAEYLLRRLYAVQPGDVVLVHAAAGGMGVLLSQWARALGATVIGTVGSEAKRAVALAHGCHHVVNYREGSFVDAVLALTGGEGVAVVYDAVGKDVFVPSLQCLRPCGMAINYGTASGDVEAFDLQLLHARSLIVSRPTLRTYIASPQALAGAAATLFAAVAAGQLRLEVNHRYPLAAVRDAHRDLEGRATTGSAVLIP
ncbi:NADPH2:quinone reductase [Cupriavidus alkaliphilus]|nr:NADPH2:quinone reductase [Cupriavidus alkaliphilus]